MSHVLHELHEEFPEFSDKIHNLKVSNNHFKKLLDEYHAVNREIHRMETELEPVSTAQEEESKRLRISLKDNLFEMLQKD